MKEDIKEWTQPLKESSLLLIQVEMSKGQEKRIQCPHRYRTTIILISGIGWVVYENRGIELSDRYKKSLCCENGILIKNYERRKLIFLIVKSQFNK